MLKEMLKEMTQGDESSYLLDHLLRHRVHERGGSQVPLVMNCNQVGVK